MVAGDSMLAQLLMGDVRQVQTRRAGEEREVLQRACEAGGIIASALKPAGRMPLLPTAWCIIDPCPNRC